MIENNHFINRLKQKDIKAFEEFYVLYYPKLLGFSKKFKFSLVTPKDFVQDTFLCVYNNSPLLKENIALDRQVYVICRNLILNQIKREKKFELLDKNDFLIDLVDEELDSFAEEDIAFLNSCIENLPIKRKEIFVLHKINKYSYEEIVEKTNLSKKTIANHIYLAFKFICEEFKKR